MSYIDGILCKAVYTHSILNKIIKKKNKILIEVDVADHFFGVNVGVYRSPLRKPEDVTTLAREIEKLEEKAKKRKPWFSSSFNLK